MEQVGVSVIEFIQLKYVKPKMRARKLISSVDWQRMLKQKGVKQVEIKTRATCTAKLDILPKPCTHICVFHTNLTTAFISPSSINRLIYAAKISNVSCEVRTEYVIIIYVNFRSRTDIPARVSVQTSNCYSRYRNQFSYLPYCHRTRG